MKKTLPQLTRNINTYGKTIKLYADSSAKKRVEGVKGFAQSFIASGGLTPKLKRATIDAKLRKGLLFPDHPLYGLGSKNARSMINGLKVRKLKNGWRVQPEGIHHSGLRMVTIFAIHEFGASLKNGGRIPARKLMRKSVAEQGLVDLLENQKQEKKIAKGLVK
ncbi:hypothetical protein EHQ53_14025 [Leptospira langatensis]|uniref:Phage morphogenesis protein n=1 Tax=Leptospira langatensis TaxID=2484983 RepID=A0ABY2MAZ9_9LEPT|nr:hypothetical protein [Leptospira langatensis]TGL39635.1 hypothetical protein EHQ53_14025 [Leptospira langatensis]